ncbi:LytTR family transcriptional regulator DNA-binding domain-containing protein [Sporolactobacillus vineae]|uniref:LytTR family transcriptional regulator DNA-binding domain-containing protein n=1 Tax=Sporolactobacillus vineae TaxID=444463 RepID=UPI00031F2155|nr:LytTR family transcriptional regulator DNA-binding domain-containing protein [Sporolactobacillus vineae]
MLHIYLCEDNQQQLNVYAQIVNNQIMIFEYDARVVEKTGDPAEIVTAVRKNREQGGLYLLDIEFAGQLVSGLDLAVMIRTLDVTAKIIFVTTHSEMAFLTFKRKVEPFDYILKDQGFHSVKKQLEEDLRLVWQRTNEAGKKLGTFFSYHMGNLVRRIPMDELLFVETSAAPHRLIAHAVHAQSQFNGNLAEIEREYPELFRCHKCFLINLDNVVNVDISTRTVEFINHLKCDVALRRIRQLKQILSRHPE